MRSVMETVHGKESPVRTMLAVACVTMLGGCYAGALEPWFPPSERMDITQAEGHWEAVEGNTHLQISDEGEHLLRVAIHDKDGEDGGAFLVSATRLEHGTWLDAQLDGEAEPAKTVNGYVIRPHFVLKADVDGDRLRLWLVETRWFKNALGTLGLPVYPPLSMDDDPAQCGPRLITAPTAELGKLLRHLDSHDESEALGVPVVFRRTAPHER